MHPARRRTRISGRKIGRVVHRKTDDSLVVLDNPDDGEIFTTGDNADVAAESRGGIGGMDAEDDEEEE